MSHAIIIPIYCENRNTINLCNELQNFGAEHIVVVNDGLNPKSEYFNELTSIGCHLVHLKNNNGKGASLKAGIKYAHDNLYNITGYITCDADGQHTANDVMKISRMLDLRNGSLILGKRDYKKSKMPINIRIGNKLSSAYFKVITGKSCRDTQTGLRGIPAFLYDTVMKTKGSCWSFPNIAGLQAKLRRCCQNRRSSACFWSTRKHIRSCAAHKSGSCSTTAFRGRFWVSASST